MADDSASVGVAARPPEQFRPVAASVGTIAAGVMLAALLVPGAGTDVVVSAVPLAALARGAGVLALLAFVARRQADAPPVPAGVVAALAGLVVAGADLLTLFESLNAWQQPGGLPMAAAAAIPVVGMGAAMALELPEEPVFTATTDIGVATFVGLLGFLVTVIGAAFIALPILSVAGTDAIGVRYPVTTVAAALATVAFVVGALQWLDRDRSWLDVSVPSLRDLGMVVAGLVALLVVLQGLTAVISQFGLPLPESSVEQQAQESNNPEFLLVLVPLSFLAIAPSEELLYRGVVQKYLYDSLGKNGAVVAASVIFAVIHFSQYASPNPVRMFVSLSVVFILSLGLGYIYARTDNLVVPILIHGAYNALIFIAMYARVTGGA